MNQIKQIAKKLIIPFIGSILYTFGFPTILASYHFNHFIFSIVGLSLVFFHFSPNEKKISSIEVYSIILLMLAIHLLGFYWITGTIKEFGGIGAPFNYVIFIFSSIVISPQYLVFLFAYHFYKKYGSNISFFKNNSTIIISILFTLIELYTPQEFPAHIGDPFISLAPYLGLAPIFGKTIFSFFSMLLALTIKDIIKDKKINLIHLFSFTLFIFLNFVIPLPYEKFPHLKDLNFRVVQGNIGNYLKYSSEMGNLSSIQEVSERYYSLSKNESELGKLDLIIWPETAYPFYITSLGVNKRSHTTLFNVVEETKAPIFFGGYSYKENDLNGDSFEDVYNTAFLFNKYGKIEQKYFKHKLLAFGETLPFGQLTPYLAKVITNISYFASGTEFTLFKLDDIPFIPLICYEYLLPSFVRNYLNSVNETPKFIINLTNDSWFGDSIEPYQHLFLGKWRAIEFQIPIIRSTNTGVTSIIYPNGKESKQLGIGEINYLDEKISLKSREKSLFEIWGNSLFFIFVIFYSTICVALRRRRKT